jgi:hypothetical protein
MADRLEHLISLINKTGDKLIVYDRQRPDESFVIMGAQHYENLLDAGIGVRGLTEDELIDKINQDIATWKSERLEVPESAHFSANQSDEVEAPSPAWQPVAEPERRPKKNTWSIPENRKRGAEEIIEDPARNAENHPINL